MLLGKKAKKLDGGADKHGDPALLFSCMKCYLLLLCFSVSLVSLSPISAADRVYEVRVVNRARSGLTSIMWATHGPRARMYRRGKKASRGVAELAKDGILSILRRELVAQQKKAKGVDSIGVGFGPGPKRQSTFRVRSSPGHRLFSWSTMAVCSNDTFAGQDSFRLPRYVGQTKTKLILAYDAGAEVNTESRDDVPCLGAHGVGPEEDKPIRLSDAVRGDGDIPKSRGWGKYIARITITRVR